MVEPWGTQIGCPFNERYGLEPGEFGRIRVSSRQTARGSHVGMIWMGAGAGALIQNGAETLGRRSFGRMSRTTSSDAFKRYWLLESDAEGRQGSRATQDCNDSGPGGGGGGGGGYIILARSKCLNNEFTENNAATNSIVFLTQECQSRSRFAGARSASRSLVLSQKKWPALDSLKLQRPPRQCLGSSTNPHLVLSADMAKLKREKIAQADRRRSAWAAKAGGPRTITRRSDASAVVLSSVFGVESAFIAILGLSILEDRITTLCSQLVAEKLTENQTESPRKLQAQENRRDIKKKSEKTTSLWDEHLEGIVGLGPRPSTERFAVSAAALGGFGQIKARIFHKEGRAPVADEAHGQRRSEDFKQLAEATLADPLLVIGVWI
ncbi:hypothetical protein C8R46DRAFT_1040882 [Mycena filopes]|nr:hypothetical protein C8R46DRAFT_1040882 [Mycena filopes]